LIVESVPKSTVFGTPIFAGIKHRHYWVSQSSFSEGFRNTLGNRGVATRGLTGRSEETVLVARRNRSETDLRYGCQTPAPPILQGAYGKDEGASRPTGST
jgi:hypothetical protein